MRCGTCNENEATDSYADGFPTCAPCFTENEGE